MSRIPNKVCHTMLASMWQFIRVFEFSSPSSESLQVSGVMEFKLVAVRHRARSKPWPSDGWVTSYRNRAVMVPSYFRLRQSNHPAAPARSCPTRVYRARPRTKLSPKKESAGWPSGSSLSWKHLHLWFRKANRSTPRQCVPFHNQMSGTLECRKALGAGHHPRQARAARFLELTSHSCQRAA
jgi:hypothetical protein